MISLAFLVWRKYPKDILKEKKINPEFKMIFGRAVEVTNINDCRILTDRLTSKNRKRKSNRSLCLGLSYFFYIFFWKRDCWVSYEGVMPQGSKIKRFFFKIKSHPPSLHFCRSIKEQKKLLSLWKGKKKSSKFRFPWT